MTVIDLTEFTSPIGQITLAVRDGRLCALSFSDGWPRRRQQLEKRFREVHFQHTDSASDIVRRLHEYFGGDLDALASIQVDPGGTSFQQRVWHALRKVAPAHTVSYGHLARAIGSPSACRAVGAANGSNPVGIVIPCHRVIGATGALTGYGGGIERKRWLLEHERHAACQTVQR